MRVIIQKDYEQMSKWASDYIVDAINKRGGEKFVLGLPTGSTPLAVYRNLIQDYKNKRVSFKNVITFNMDEYVGLDPNHKQSYHFFMYDNFFNHIDIDKKNIHILNGMAKDLKEECQKYEEEIAALGPIDLFMGGLGSDGHLAFNEPFSSLSSRTREKTLTTETILANARFFDLVAEVPKTSLTVGVQTVCDSKEVLLLVSSHSKAIALKNVIEGPLTHTCTASSLQLHPKSIVVCDEDSCGELKVSTYKYFKDIEKK